MARGSVYEVTIRIPGEKRPKKKSFRTTEQMFGYLHDQDYPVGTKVWVMVDLLRMGFGLEVRPGGLIY